MESSSGAAGVPPSTAVQFPTEDDGIDCPEACEDEDEAPPQGESPLANGHGHGDGPAIPGKGASTSKGKEKTEAPNNPNVCWESRDDFESSEEDDDDEDDVGEAVDKWKLDDGAVIICDCIVCNHQTIGYEAADAMKTHIESSHNLPFSKLRTTFSLNYPSFVQFVRWAREQKREGKIEESIQTIFELAPSQVPWLDDKYLLPPKKEDEQDVDYFLTLDYFATDDISVEEAESSRGGLSVEELVAQVEQLKIDKQRMTEVFQRILAEGKAMGSNCTKLWVKSGGVPSCDFSNRKGCRRRGNIAVDEVEKLQILRLMGPSAKESVISQVSNNQLYFESYNEIAIHHEMVFDRARTEAYQSAIVDRAADIKGKCVMDLGCGTGILSMFCAQQDPKVVYAIEKSDIIFDAISSGFENDFDSKIQFMHKDIDKDDMTFAIGKIDVLVSEFMGYFLFFEGMTETFLRARDKFLKPGGILLPNACSVELVPLGRSGLFRSRVECWESAYGFKMPALVSRVLNETLIDIVSPEEIIGNAVEVKSLDLMTCKEEDIKIDADFTFEFDKYTKFVAIAGYFMVDFQGVDKKITLSTSPYDTPTHWKQAVFFLPRHFIVDVGQKMEGHITSHPHPENPRWLVVSITIGGLTKKYEFH